MTSAQERTRALNDELRIYHRGGRIMVTAGVKALGAELIQRVDEAIAAFDEFDEDSDPHANMISAWSRLAITRLCSRSTITTSP